MNLDFEKYSDGLIPTVVQHFSNGKILMVGFSSPQSLEKTKETKKATFFSRSKNDLWTKGETSGNFLDLKAIQWDCDSDTLIFFCDPNGPTCHTGKETCFFSGDDYQTTAETLFSVFDTIIDRKNGEVDENSYVQSLFKRGLDRIAQKVGEEGVETVIASKNDDRDDFIGEASDLIFHLMVLLVAKGVSLEEIADKFKSRKK